MNRIGRISPIGASLMLVLGELSGCGGSKSTPPDFSFQVSATTLTLTPGGPAQQITLSAGAQNGFAGTINVTENGVPAGVNASPVTLSIVPGTPQQVTFSASATTPAKSATVQFVATSGMVSHSASVAITVQAPPPDFSFQISPTTLTLTSGGPEQQVTLSAAAQNGFSGTINVTEDGVPAGVNASPATLSIVPGTPQQVTFSASATTPAKSATVQFVAASGTVSHSASVAITVQVPAGVDVVTYHDDVARTGLNPNETILTPSNVASATFGLLRMLPVDGKVDGEPLYLSNLAIGDQLHNVVYAVTEHDSVYAFDADSGAQLWKASILGSNESTSGNHNCTQISPEIGITSTPVIDRSAGPNGTIFVVGMTLDQAGKYHQRLHALDVSNGAERAGSPVEIAATYPGAGAGSSNGNVVFDPDKYAERVGLLLLNGTIYLGWTSHCDQGPYTGWLMGYNESTLSQSAVLNLTPNGYDGAIWMSGAGLAADPAGNIYFLDGNGMFDPQLDASGFPVHGDFGNGFLKVSTTGGLAVADYFEPYNTVAESYADLDLGSGGVLVLPDLQDAAGATRHLAVGTGKDQKIYVVDRDAMGKFNSQNNNGLYQEIDGAITGVWSMPAYFNNTVYYGAQSDAVKAFPITDARLGAAAVKTANRFRYPGTTPGISANGTADGIVWAIENSSPAVLHAYEASSLRELYNSNQAANGRDHFGDGNKFMTPLVVHGMVFAGTPNAVAVFGLLQ